MFWNRSPFPYPFLFNLARTIWAAVRPERIADS